MLEPIYKFTRLGKRIWISVTLLIWFYNFLSQDYEYASYNPIAFDIANHFCEMTADYHTDTPHVLDYIKYPGMFCITLSVCFYALGLDWRAILTSLCLTGLEERKRFVQIYLSASGNFITFSIESKLTRDKVISSNIQFLVVEMQNTAPSQVQVVLGFVSLEVGSVLISATNVGCGYFNLQSQWKGYILIIAKLSLGWLFS